MTKYIMTSFVPIVFLTSVVTADVHLPAIISDNMIIQSDMHVPVWGWADPNEFVTVSIANQKKTITTDTSGKWIIWLNPLNATSTPLEMTVTGENTILIKNILIGQIWLASGQSNMEWPVKQAFDSVNEIHQATYTGIRLFTVARKIAYEPVSDCEGRWVECSPQTIGDFSAVAYFFGRSLHQKLQQPVGLIHSSWSGTIAETWMSADSLRTNPDFASILQRHEELIKKYLNDEADYDKALLQWQEEINDISKIGKSQPVKPTSPVLSPNGASLLFNGMIAPVIPFAIKGVIWYQGEANVNRAKQYQTLFPALISDWRTQWKQGDFPFFFVQLANFRVPSTWYDPIVWAELREAQLKTLNVPNTGMAVAIDIGDPNDIHPKNKQEVGRRLALCALAKAYGHTEQEYSGPMYKNMNIHGDQIILEFDTECKANNKQLKGFMIAGEDREFVSAQAQIYRGDTSIEEHICKSRRIVVWSPDINKPVAVRYAWLDNPENSTLQGKTGLPASPFRTDDWPGITDHNN